MGTCRDPRPEEDRYYEPIIGTEIVKVYQDPESVWLHLSDGSVLEILGVAEGFEIEIHPPES